MQNTPCVRAPMGTAWLTKQKMSSVPNVYGVTLRSKFSKRETTKPAEGDMKIQRGELTNILHLLKNIHT